MTEGKRNWIKEYFLQQKALFYRNYRLFVMGQTLSLVGTWIQRMAMLWLVYRLTHSAFLLGLIGFCEQIPIFFIAPFAGVFADRWNRHKALIRIESLALLQAFLLGFITFMGWVEVWHLIFLSLMLGVVNAFEAPMRKSFVVEMVDQDKESLTNAIALNSTVFNLSRLIGPSIAGVLISLVGEAWCFMANAFSYALVVLCLLLMHLPAVTKRLRDAPRVFQRLKEGVQYIRTKKIMQVLLSMLAVVSFSNASLKTLAPVFAKDILGGDAQTLGFLMSASGIGAICGALYLTKRRTIAQFKKILSFTGIFLGTGIICFAISRSLVLSLLFIAFAGLGQMVHTTSTNTMLQLLVDEDKRGRLMSFYTVCLQGTMPFGSMVAGVIAGLLGGQWAMGIMGVICLSGTYFFRIRNIHDHLKYAERQNHSLPNRAFNPFGKLKG